MKIKTIIFDLDGTLLDTLGDLGDAVNAALQEKGYPMRTDDEIRNFVGNGVATLMRRAVPEGTAQDTVETCLARFRAHYDKHMMNRTAPYAGIPALLQELKAKGIVMGVLSNKYDPAAKALTAHYFPGDITQTFGERTGVARKPDPAAVLEMLQILGAERETTLYVGDSDVDMQTAGNARLFAVGVTWGFRSREALEAAGADALVDHPSDILKLLDQTGLPKQ